MIDRHPLLASDLLSYMSIIREAVVDAPFTGLINTTNNFDVELHRIQPEHGFKLMAIGGYNLSQTGR